MAVASGAAVAVGTGVGLSAVSDEQAKINIPAAMHKLKVVATRRVNMLGISISIGKRFKGKLMELVHVIGRARHIINCNS